MRAIMFAGLIAAAVFSALLVADRRPSRAEVGIAVNQTTSDEAAPISDFYWPGRRPD